MRLAGETAIITGGAMGIGAEIARLFATEGAAVTVADIAEAAGEDVVAGIREAGGEARFVRCNVARAADVARAVRATVAAHGQLTIAVLNAGIDIAGGVVDTSEAEFWRCLRVNLGGVFHGMKFAIPAMLAAGRGSIVAVASIQALMGFRSYAAYAAAKGAVVALTRQVACDWGPRGIRANTICPSTVLTPMVQAELDRSDDPGALMRSWVEPHPLGRIGTPADVARAALYLASAESAWVTAQTLVIDGGVTGRGFH